jgi:acyl carrier protein
METVDPIESTIHQIIIERLAVSHHIEADTPLFVPEIAGGVGLDSLASLEIIAAVSDQFQLPLDDVEAADFVSIASLADYLRRHGAEVV